MRPVARINACRQHTTAQHDTQNVTAYRIHVGEVKDGGDTLDHAMCGCRSVKRNRQCRVASCPLKLDHVSFLFPVIVLQGSRN